MVGLGSRGLVERRARRAGRAALRSGERIATMRASVRHPVLLLALIPLGCGPGRPSPSTQGALAQPIVGGEVAPSDPEVFKLRIRDPQGADFDCTATLIGARTLLTAAHCLEDPGVTVHATNLTYVAEATEQDWLPVVEYRLHPGYDSMDPELPFDLAVALLHASPGVAPKPWNRASVEGFEGRPLRVVGYGDTSASGGGSGTRRTVDLTFGEITDDLVYTGVPRSKGFCYGDSGGGSFHTFADGVERLVGVHSFVEDSWCTWGGDARTDFASHASFIQGWLDEKEPACGAACACAQDGVCGLQCPDPAGDPDCRPLGSTCTADQHCASRLCFPDPSQPSAYCSRPCAGGGDCPATMECAPAGRCALRSDPPPAPPVLLELARAEGPSAGSCAAAPGGALWTGALLLVALTRRRR